MTKKNETIYYNLYLLFKNELITVFTQKWFTIHRCVLLHFSTRGQTEHVQTFQLIPIFTKKKKENWPTDFHLCLQYWIFFLFFSHSGLIFGSESQKFDTNYFILFFILFYFILFYFYLIMYSMSKMFLLWRALFLRMYISFLADGWQQLASMIQSLGWRLIYIVGKI